MKILQVITSLRIGGAEKLIVDMAPLLCKLGHQVDVLLFDGVETAFKKELRDNGIQVYQLGNGVTVYNPLLIVKLIPFLRRYDIVHTHNAACQYFVAFAKVLSFSRVKLITTEHNTTNRRRMMKWLKPIEKWVYNRYTAIISISDKSTELLMLHLNRRENIYTVFNGIDINRFYTAKALDRTALISSNPLILVTMVAGFREAKDQDTLIKAITLLPEAYCLCLVGDGERRPICEALVKELKIKDRVVFTGLRSDIPQILKASDIVVMSSHWEGLSLSSIEGMSVGKPFIASDVNGLHEITLDGGILFPAGDAEQLAFEIKQLSEDANYAARIAVQCKERAAEYDIRKTVEAYSGLYDTI